MRGMKIVLGRGPAAATRPLPVANCDHLGAASLDLRDVGEPRRDGPSVATQTTGVGCSKERRIGLFTAGGVRRTGT